MLGRGTKRQLSSHQLEPNKKAKEEKAKAKIRPYTLPYTGQRAAGCSLEKDGKYHAEDDLEFEDEDEDDGADDDMRPPTVGLRDLPEPSHDPVTSREELYALAKIGGLRIKESAQLKHLIDLVYLIYQSEKDDLGKSPAVVPPRKKQVEAAVRGSDPTNHKGLEACKPPLSNIRDIFAAIAKKAIDLGFQKACQTFAGKPLRVVTMCSGTESPVIAMTLLKQAFEDIGNNSFDFSHLASAEIEPSKQAYIERNFNPPVIFRDVTEFGTVDETNPTDSIECHTAHGAKEALPKDVDIVIAGSSCVDYSYLTQDPKTWHQEGESKATMLGVMGFAQRVNPAIVILENVRKAPWSDISEAWDKIGYYTQTVIVDTKNFYIPQTRNRGYVFAINKKSAKKLEVGVIDAGHDFASFMTNMQCRASAPYTDFLLPDNDIHLQREMRAWRNMEFTSDRGQDWGKCRHRYAAFRAWHSLGDKRPMTKWQNNGTCDFPDFGNGAWARMQRERIWDTLDIDFLKYAGIRRFGYDMNSKCRFLNLSQNVDRDSDARHWGVIGCLTPSGMPYDTRRVGPVTGREALALQGIPIDDLIIGEQNSRELQDLAGNAMTTTVVCAAICSAIIAAKKLIADRKAPACSKTPNPGSSATVSSVESKIATNQAGSKTIEALAASYPVLVPKRIPLSDGSGSSANAMLGMAIKTLALCRCEVFDINDRRSVQSFKFCKDCGHTACHVCAKNPLHNYGNIPSEVTDLRQRASVFSNVLLDLLPKSLVINFQSLDVFDDVCPPQDLLSEKRRADYTHLLKATNGDVLHFREVSRSNSWRVVYEGERSYIEMRLGPMMFNSFEPTKFFKNAKINRQWLLFVKPLGDDTDALEPFRKLLKNPIARMVLPNTVPSTDASSSNALLAGQWQIWQPVPNAVTLRFVGNGEMKSAWKSKLGLQGEEFKDSFVSSEIKIDADAQDDHSLRRIVQEICGVYALHQECGAAQETLYKRVSDLDGNKSCGPPLFFFLDPAPLGHDREDSFVFARNHERTTTGSGREIVAKIERNWRPTISKGDEAEVVSASTAKCFILDSWSRCPSLQIRENPQQAIADVHFVHNSDQMSSWDAVSNNVTKRCTSTLNSFAIIKIHLNPSQQQHYKNGVQYDLRVDRPSALRDMSWILTALQTMHRCQGSFDLCQSGAAQLKTCEECVPGLPALEWKYARQQRSKAIIIKPFEIPERAAEFESRLRQRPSLLAATLHAHGAYALLDIKANVLALMHQTLGKMLKPGSEISSDKVRFAWEISPEHDTEERPIFEDLRLEKLIPNSSKDPSIVLEGLTSDLFPSQKEVLGWMWDREHRNTVQTHDTAEWHETEYEEVLAPSLGLRLDCMVEYQKVVRGGIVADEVGAGKTITSLALFLKDFQEREKLKNLETAEEPSSDLIDSKATLILVPTNLVEQWSKEYDRWLGTYTKKIKMVSLKTTEELLRISLNKIKDADLIIAAWEIFDESKYWEALGNLCWTPFTPPDADRAFQQWATETFRILQNLVKESNLANDFDAHVNVSMFWRLQAQLEENVTLLQRFKAFFDRKQKKKQLAKKGAFEKEYYQQTKTETEDVPQAHPVPGLLTDDEVQAAKEQLVTMMKVWRRQNKETIRPFLHMFRFRRLIVDEFTYVGGRTLVALINLAAPRRWLLSGTPPLTNFDSINTMAKLLGTRISTEDEAEGIFQFGKLAATASRSYAEEFRRQLLIPRSATILKKRNKQVTRFVKTFMRKNKPDYDIEPANKNSKVAKLSVVERTIYQGVCQLLLSQIIRFHKQYTKAQLEGLDYHELLMRTISMASSPEEAQVTCVLEVMKRFKEQSTDKVQQSRIEAAVSGEEEQWMGDYLMINEVVVNDEIFNEQQVLESNFDVNAPTSEIEGVPTQRDTSFLTNDPTSIWCQQIIQDEEQRFRETSLTVAQKLREIWGFRRSWMRNEQKVPDTFNENPHFGSYLFNVLSNSIGDKSVSELLVFHILQGRIRPCFLKYTKASIEKLEAWSLKNEQMASKEQQKASNELQAVADESAKPNGAEVKSENGKPKNAKPTLTELASAPAAKKEELFNRACELHNLSLNLVDRRRCLRLYNAIQTVIDQKAIKQCANHSLCGTVNLNPTNAFIMAVCGHILCEGCRNDEDTRRKTYDTCLVEGCNAPASERHFVPASSYLESGSPSASEEGTKMSDIVSEIAQILGDPDDKSAILIFVQYKSMKERLREVLEQHGVLFTDAAEFGKRAAGDKIEKFKDAFNGITTRGKKKSVATRVLLLRLDSPDSAGWNLQFASHVMFVSPLVAANAYHYESSMKQAIGRARRYGQKGTVQVYQFICAETIEVNIVEDQEKRIVIRRDNEFMVAKDKERQDGNEKDTKFMVTNDTELQDGDERDWRALDIKGAKNSATSAED